MSTEEEPMDEIEQKIYAAVGVGQETPIAAVPDGVDPETGEVREAA